MSLLPPRKPRKLRKNARDFRRAWLRFKLEKLDGWIHELTVSRRDADLEFQKLQPRPAARSEDKA